jgi:hypothetical protein
VPAPAPPPSGAARLRTLLPGLLLSRRRRCRCPLSPLHLRHDVCGIRWRQPPPRPNKTRRLAGCATKPKSWQPVTPPRPVFARCCLIEAPWLVNGNHGASITARQSPAPHAPRRLSSRGETDTLGAPPGPRASTTCASPRSGWQLSTAAHTHTSVLLWRAPMPTGVSGGCLIDVPCPPFTSHGASIRQQVHHQSWQVAPHLSSAGRRGRRPRARTVAARAATPSPARAFPPQIRDKNRRGIGKSQPKWTASKNGNARLTLPAHPGATPHSTRPWSPQTPAAAALRARHTPRVGVRGACNCGCENRSWDQENMETEVNLSQV